MFGLGYYGMEILCVVLFITILTVVTSRIIDHVRYVPRTAASTSSQTEDFAKQQRKCE